MSVDCAWRCCNVGRDYCKLCPTVETRRKSIANLMKQLHCHTILKCCYFAIYSQSLNLAGCGASDVGACALANALATHTSDELCDLDLRFNDIGERGGRAFKTALQRASALCSGKFYLHLGYNRELSEQTRSQLMVRRKQRALCQEIFLFDERFSTIRL